MRISERLLKLLEEIGKASLLALQAVYFLLRKPPKLKHFLHQFTYIAAETSAVVLVTSTFTGGVIALQTYSTFHRFNAEYLIGSAMTANIGTMRITQQIDALEVMAVNPVRYLVTPRLFSTTIGVPFLTVLSNVAGIFGGWFVATRIFNVNE